jgi:hypothetical protein
MTMGRTSLGRASMALNILILSCTCFVSVCGGPVRKSEERRKDGKELLSYSSALIPIKAGTLCMGLLLNL